MILEGLVRKIVDERSGYVATGIAHNDYELYVLINNLVEKLRQDFGADYDLSQIRVY